MLDLDMSPYGAFVWPAWGISAVVLAALSARALIAARRWKRELARLAGTTTRNIRVYRDRGLLHPPLRVGRIALYNDTHLTRLRLITSMLDRCLIPETSAPFKSQAYRDLPDPFPVWA